MLITGITQVYGLDWGGELYLKDPEWLCVPAGSILDLQYDAFCTVYHTRFTLPDSLIFALCVT